MGRFAARRAECAAVRSSLSVGASGTKKRLGDRQRELAVMDGAARVIWKDSLSRYSSFWMDFMPFAPFKPVQAHCHRDGRS
jgi:hypothetical protein